MYCRQCGKQINELAVICVNCGVSTGVKDEPSAVMRMLLPVGRSPYAIAAGYLGLAAPLFIPAILAVIFGILAIRDIRKNRNKHGMGRAIFAITIGSFFIIYTTYLFITIK